MYEVFIGCYLGFRAEIIILFFECTAPSTMRCSASTGLTGATTVQNNTACRPVGTISWHLPPLATLPDQSLASELLAPFLFWILPWLSAENSNRGLLAWVVRFISPVALCHLQFQWMSLGGWDGAEHQTMHFHAHSFSCIFNAATGGFAFLCCGKLSPPPEIFCVHINQTLPCQCRCRALAVPSSPLLLPGTL